MFVIDKDTQSMTIIKKDTASFTVALDNYTLTTGDEVTFTVAPQVEQEEPLLQKTVTTFEEGAAIISLESAETDLEIGSYLYDVQVKTADGRVDTVIGPAKFKVLGGVTY